MASYYKKYIYIVIKNAEHLGETRSIFGAS